jgi:hypothetical protein
VRPDTVDLQDGGIAGDAGSHTGTRSVVVSSQGALPLLRYPLFGGDKNGGMGNAPSETSASGRIPGGPMPGIQLAAAADPLTGYATYYDRAGKKTASGQQLDSNSNSAAMYRPGVIHTEDRMNVQLQKDPNASVNVIVNDTGPFERGPDGKALLPLRPDPNIIIDLTPQAFRALTGSLKAGKVPVIVRPQPPG